MTATPSTGTAAPRDIHLALGQTTALDDKTTVQLAEFIPDYIVVDGKVYSKTSDVVNPAVHLTVTSQKVKTNNTVNVWLPEIPGLAENQISPYNFEAKDLKIGYFTGLQVSYEPGQWAVWAGVILMGIGLTFVFYVVHSRFWVVPVRDGLGGITLWVGGSANRNRDAFEQKFQKVVEKIKEELRAKPQPGPRQTETTFAGK